jgi:hypothetical protein
VSGRAGGNIEAVSFADELCPDWRKENTGPFMERIKEELTETGLQ